MTAPGERIPYFTVEKGDSYYAKRGLWTLKANYAAFMTQELAERIQKRYPGSTVVRDSGYDLFPKQTLESVGEPDAVQQLEQSLRLCLRDGLGKPKIEEICFRVLNAEV